MKNPNSKEIDSAKLEQILNAYCAGPISGIHQARTLEWVAISFSNA